MVSIFIVLFFLWIPGSSAPVPEAAPPLHFQLAVT